MRFPRFHFLAAGAALAALAIPAAAQISLPPIQQVPPEFTAVAYFQQASVPSSVSRVLLTGRSPRTLVTGETVWFYGLGIDQGKCHVYMPLGPPNTGRIARVNTDGTGLKTILSHPGYGDPLRFDPRGVALDLVDGRIYWIAPGQAFRIGSCTLGGSDPRPAAFFTDLTPQISPRSIHVDAKNDRIYWWDQVYLGFRRADVDSSGNATNLTNLCFTDQARSFDVDVENQMLYWTVGGSGAPFELRRAPIPTTTPCDLSTTGYTVFATETDPLRSFYTDLLCASPETGVVAWVSFNGELSWKPINATLAEPNQRSSSFRYLPTGGLEVVRGPNVCITFP